MRILSLPRTPIGTFMIAAAILGAISAAILGVSAAGATAADSTASPLIVEPVAAVRPVEIADGSIHLVYELLLINQSAFAVTVDSLAVLDEHNETIAEIDGERLASISRLSLFSGSGNVLQPSQSSFVFLDLTVPADGELPQTLRHRFSTSQSAASEQGSMTIGGLAVDADTGIEPKVAFTAGAVAVSDEAAIVLAPPLHGGGWVVFRGCCDLSSSHRGNTGIYDGEVRIAERFAVDFVRLNDDRRMITGPGNEVGSYVYYREPILAVGDGVVVSAHNDAPNQVPGVLAADISDEAAGGNAVVIDLGNGRFAFYAHMEPGSVRVEAGDAVRAGDVIGLLGNSGKSVGPHLHFHLTDNASPLDADGIPFVFESFDGQGVLTPEGFGLAMQGEIVPVEAQVLSGRHRHAMPVNSQVIDFGN